MTTKAAQLTKDFANRWENAIPSAVFSGIVGDLEHRASGGYHISIEDQVDPRNYSVTRPDDAAPPGNWARDLASAVDMSMALQDMILTYQRVLAVWQNKDDPRRNYINAVNVFDGIGDAERLDMVSGTRTYASPDHKWHTHFEFRRRYVNVEAAYDAAFSVVGGEGLTAYLSRTGQLPVPPVIPPVTPGGLPTVAAGTRTVQRKDPMMSGTDIVVIQKFIGPRQCGTPDGWFGDQTKAGVIWYQRMRGITADGIVGPQTWSNILGRVVRY